jgi:hypothetical protein
VSCLPPVVHYGVLNSRLNVPLPNKKISVYIVTAGPLSKSKKSNIIRRYIYIYIYIYKREIYCTESICTVRTRINCTIVPVTNFNIYLPYGTSESE